MLFDPNWKPKTADSDEVESLMYKAADYIETHRWAQDSYVTRNGAVCLLGGLVKAEIGRISEARIERLESDGIFEEKFPLTMRALLRLKKHLKRDPVSWNDDCDRKKSEVVSVLREAAKVSI